MAIYFIFIFFIGLCLGSFASLLAYRLPRGLPWVAVRSQCPECGHALGVRDLVPVLSWVMSKGRCRHCAAPISIRYPLLEIIGAVICGVLYWLIGWDWMLIPALVAVPFVMAGLLILLGKKSSL